MSVLTAVLWRLDLARVAGLLFPGVELGRPLALNLGMVVIAWAAGGLACGVFHFTRNRFAALATVLVPACAGLFLGLAASARFLVSEPDTSLLLPVPLFPRVLMATLAFAAGAYALYDLARRDAAGAIPDAALLPPLGVWFHLLFAFASFGYVQPFSHPHAVDYSLLSLAELEFAEVQRTALVYVVLAFVLLWAMIVAVQVVRYRKARGEKHG